MSTPAPLLTATDESAAGIRVDTYLNAVIAHTGGDWAQHRQINVHADDYLDANGKTVGTSTLRILATYNASPSPLTAALAVPLVSSGLPAGSTGSVPVFILQPADQSAVKSSVVTIESVAISATAIAYQWQKLDNLGDWADVSGQAASKLVFSGVATTQAGTYRCSATNSFGTSYSASAVLTVTTT